MADAIAHRGPDDVGFFHDGPVALGFRRLAIIDLSAAGHQPMSLDGRYTVVFNGEIYNYRDLRAELEAKGSQFKSQSDTEVLLHAFRAWGPDAIARFNGMFGLALWDAEARELYLVRDRLGKKPLYYAQTPDGMVFGSELKALFTHPQVVPSVARERIPAFLAYRYLPGAETLFAGISCVSPGCWVKVTPEHGVAPERRYWDYSFADEPEPASTETLRGELRDLLEDSVRRRMIADVPFGAFLSGGLDSSVIVALMSRLHPEPIKTFSVGFTAGVDESQHARAVAEAFRTDHHEERVDADRLIAHVPAVLHARETPITAASDIPIYMLSRAARRKVTVVLSGEGSDEILAGYPKYAFAPWADRLGALLPSGLLRGLAASLPFGLRRAQLALECAAEPDRFERYAAWFGAFGPAERARVLQPELGAADGVHQFSASVLAGKRLPSAVEEMLYLDTRHWLAANLLLRGDRMTMAHSLELRCPFLDYRLVEFAAGRVPRSLKVKGLSGKWLLKQVAADLLPASIVNRKKWGFKVPTGEWFRGPLRGVLEDVLLSARARARGYFREERVRELVRDHAEGRVDHDKQLWILFQLELWHLMFVDRVLAPTDSLTSAAAAEDTSPADVAAHAVP
jgi:asparagine synthase (glutamine-hydrolysing)